MAGLAGLMLAVSSAVRGIGAGSPGPAFGRPDHVCANFTNSTRQLVMIDSTGDDFFQCLGLTVDGDTPKAIRLETHGLPSAGQPTEPKPVQIREFPKSVLESARGAVLDGPPGHDAIVLRGHVPAVPGNATLVLSYLYNGITNEYRSCQITLLWTPDSGWHLINRFDQRISHIAIVTRQVPVIGVIGIANLEGACPMNG